MTQRIVETHMRKPWTLLAATLAFATIAACSSSRRDTAPKPGGESPYLLIFAGDEDGADSDFLAVIDLRSDSSHAGKVIATKPIGMKKSLPHHMEYTLPPAGEPLFMNAHHHEMSMLVDLSDPRAPQITKTFTPPEIGRASCRERV